MNTDCVACKLFIVVRILGVRQVLAKLQQKNTSKYVDFLKKFEVTLFTPKSAVIWPKTSN